MEIFSLTETEFFRMLTEGKNDNLHIAYKDFVLQVSEICNSAQNMTSQYRHCYMPRWRLRTYRPTQCARKSTITSRPSSPRR